MSQEKSFGNNYDLGATLRFFRKWWKVQLIVFVVAAAASVVASLLVTPRYKSSAVMFPTNSNRLSKAIMDYHYSLDFMDYGVERDCEYALQILSSESMEQDVCNHFNLMEHYGINPDAPHALFDLSEQYRSNITVKRTEFLGIEIGVLDVDPQWAADIANYMACNYDTLCHRIHHDRANDACLIMKGVCDSMYADLLGLDSLMAAQPQHRATLQLLASEKCQQLADLQTRATQTAVDLQQNASYKFWLDKATPADKKAYPKRAVIVLLGTFGAWIMCVLALLLVEAFKKEDNEE